MRRAYGAPACLISCFNFQGLQHDCSLGDLGSIGPRFTWRGAQTNNVDRVLKRLDRAVANQSWRLLFAEATVQVLPRIKSDHHPLIVHLDGMSNLKGGQRPFRYMVAWQFHKEFKQFLCSKWMGSGDLEVGLALLQKDLVTWNKEVFGRIDEGSARPD